MNIPESITLLENVDEKEKLFEIKTLNDFIRCVSVLRKRLLSGKIHVQILSRDKYKMASVRAAYWCWMQEQYKSAQHDGTSIPDLHKRYKAKYLLPILCAYDVEFADMLLDNVNRCAELNLSESETEKRLSRLLSIADGSTTGYKEMVDYFSACQMNETYL
jgi:hypothetical protein